ncbi:DUF3237 family protein [Pelagicoccus sp. SDUM812003]|uniref:DUF3237 family protein n=1 Tax=Pelagicoccus sp. SDUM812003 TaxID=3041267 RepID=UPI00280D7855|nr:DUF3237 family protein [Pelagicoccus sp. SDUM812003]MDQ8205027.1 DUF3237 family protein [Pelagicoccus sp. SDUM812003]
MSDNLRAEDDRDRGGDFETEFVYEAHVTIGEIVEVGETSKSIRRYIPITGGRFEGPRLKGTVLPGGADWQTERTDGGIELDALYSMRCDDGTVIIVRNQGIISPGGSYLKTTPTFTVPDGPHDWLDDFLYFGTVSGSEEPDTVVIRVYRVK